MNLPLGGKCTNQQAEHIASRRKNTEILITNSLAAPLSLPWLSFTCYHNDLHACLPILLHFEILQGKWGFYAFSHFLLRCLLWKVSNICKQEETRISWTPAHPSPSSNHYQTIIKANFASVISLLILPSSRLFWNNSWTSVSFPSTICQHVSLKDSYLCKI